MGLKVLARKAISMRGFGFWSSTKRVMKANDVLEAICSKVSGGEVVVSKANEEGVVRVRVVVKKQDLKEMLGVINKNGDHQRPLLVSSVEGRLNMLRRKHVFRRNLSRKVAWLPQLHSIPEEF